MLVSHLQMENPARAIVAVAPLKDDAAADVLFDVGLIQGVEVPGLHAAFIILLAQADCTPRRSISLVLPVKLAAWILSGLRALQYLCGFEEL